MNMFEKKSVALIFTGLPTEEPNLTVSQIRRLLKDKKCFFARYTSDFNIDSLDKDTPQTADKGWWYCIKTGQVSLDSLTAKQRYRVRKGLKNNVFSIINEDEFIHVKDEIYDSYIASIADYPKYYKQVEPKESLLSWIQKAIKSDKADIWLCRDCITNRIVGFAHCRLKREMVELSSVKLNPDFFRSEVNAGLAYRICEFYLNSGKYRYVCDGQRNIVHQTAYQDFLVSVLGFRKAKCKLNIIYTPPLKIIITILYPLRGLLDKLSHHSRFLYKMHCLLFQEQCARESSDFADLSQRSKK